MKKCCILGHEPKQLPWGYNEEDRYCIQFKLLLSKKLEYLIETREIRHFIITMTIGIGFYAAEILFALRKIYADIVIEFVLSHEQQHLKWRIKDQERYFSLAAQTDIETTIQIRYSRFCISKRNRYMIDKSDYLVAVWNGEQNEIYTAVSYAQKRKTDFLICLLEDRIEKNQSIPKEML